MLDVVECGIAALLASGAVTLLIYAALDHSEKLASKPKIRTALKLALILSALASAGYQFYSADLDRKQAAEDRRQAAADAAQSQLKIDKLTQDIKQITVESQEKIQAERLNLAKAQSEAEIRAIGTEFSDFAEAFPTNTQERAARLTKLKRDLKDAQADAERVAQETERKNHLEFTAEVYAPTYFALHFLQETVRAYAARTGEHIKIDTMDLPDDFYAHAVNGEITFPSGAVWSLTIHVSGDQIAWFVVTFTDSDHQQTGELDTAVNLGRRVISLSYSATPPVPNPSTINGDAPLSDYETTVKRAYLLVIATQLVHAAKQ